MRRWPFSNLLTINFPDVGGMTCSFRRPAIPRVAIFRQLSSKDRP